MERVGILLDRDKERKFMKLVYSLFFISTLAFAVTAGKVWRVPTGGTYGKWGPVNLADGTNAVTGTLGRANLPSTGYQLSSSTGTFSTSSGTYVDVTNATVTITVTGRPVIISLVGDGANPGNNTKLLATNSGAVTSIECDFKLLQGSTVLNEFQLLKAGSSASNHAISIPVGAINTVDVPAAGTYTYKLQAKQNVASTTCAVFYSKLLAYEIMGN